MKQVTADYMTMIASRQQRWIIGHLYTFTLASGFQDFFTDLDIDVFVNGQTYRSNVLRIEGMKLKIGVGLETDEQDVKISAQPGDRLGVAYFFQSVVDGALDGAWLTRDRAIWAVRTGLPLGDVADNEPIQILRMFYGRVAQIQKLGRTFVELKVKSPLGLLDIEMPRNTYQSGCNWTLFDPGCTLSKESYAVPGSVDGAAPNFVTWAGGVPGPIGGDSNPYFAGGRLRFTSGNLTGLQVTIVWNNDTQLLLMGFAELPAPGDTFTAYPGCMKTTGSCHMKFNNLQHFRGFPFVPPVDVAL